MATNERVAPAQTALSRLWRAPGRWFWLGVWLVVFLASLWQYRATLRGDFEDYDWTSGTSKDTRLMLSLAHQPSPLPYFRQALPPVHAFYRPGTVVWFWVEARVLGYRPTAWRVASVALHAAVITLWAILVALAAGSRAPALLAAACFAWRGQHEEVLTWIATQPDLPVAALCLAALLVLWRPRWAWGWRVAVGAALSLIAVFTKESAAALFIFVALTVALWPVREGARRRALAVAGFALVAGAYLLARRMALGELFGALKEGNLPPLRANLHVYLRMIWPPALSLIVFLPSLSLGWMILLTTSFWRVLVQHVVYYGGAAVLLRRAWRPAALFALWILATPLPTLPGLMLGERYAYLPTMGWAALAGLLLWQLGKIAIQAVRTRWGRAGKPTAAPTPNPLAA
jgi:hypothetical protein